jgi:hypothetical protein
MAGSCDHGSGSKNKTGSSLTNLTTVNFSTTTLLHVVTHIRRSHVVDLRHVKEPYEHDRYSSAKFSGHVSHPRFTCFATRCLLALLTDVPGGRIRLARTG